MEQDNELKKAFCVQAQSFLQIRVYDKPPYDTNTKIYWKSFRKFYTTNIFFLS